MFAYKRCVIVQCSASMSVGGMACLAHMVYRSTKARYMKISGAIVPIRRHIVRSRYWCFQDEPGGGMSGWMAVQQQRAMVRMQNQRMSRVPR